MKIYLASSWRNTYQPGVLSLLREAGHDVYDFRNPAPGNSGFSWRSIDPGLQAESSAPRLRSVLAHPIAVQGFAFDFDAMRAADVCVLLLPSGMSAHLESGWMSGAGKRVVVLAPEMREPELMYKCFDGSDGVTPLFETVAEVIEHLATLGKEH